eukprot:5279452-Prymnesium_polylepis.1
MSQIDLPAQLHFALFNGSNGFVHKPPEMCARVAGERVESPPDMEGEVGRRSSCSIGQRSSHSTDANAPKISLPPSDAYWPPPRETVHQTTVEVLSLHMLPKVGRGPCP